MPRKPKRWGQLNQRQRKAVIKVAIAYCEDNHIELPGGITQGTFFACIFHNVEWSGWIDRAAIKKLEEKDG